MSTLEELKNRLAAVKKEIREASEVAFKEATRELFAKYPAIESFSWTQYTPFFNDGEPCTFRVNYEPRINGKDKYGEEGTPDVPYEVYKEIERMLEEIDEDTMQVLFGDHVEIVVSRGGVKTEEYDHE